jgi:hypothetical protein
MNLWTYEVYGTDEMWGEQSFYGVVQSYTEEKAKRFVKKHIKECYPNVKIKSMYLAFETLKHNKEDIIPFVFNCNDY